VTNREPLLTTGLPGLDSVLKGLLPGDNIVWEAVSVADYRPFVDPYVRAALDNGRPLVYFRFAHHDPLVADDTGVRAHVLHPEQGFETFINEVRGTIRQMGRGAHYLFDCLSDLAVDWYSDLMLANFFMLTCPFLFDLETITYFALLRNSHSAHATRVIAETTQLLLDVHCHRGTLYVHPLKVQHRYSGTMHMLHAWEGDQFLPVVRSADISQILTKEPWYRSGPAQQQLGLWNRTFIEAMDALEEDGPSARTPRVVELTRRLLRMAVTRDARVLSLAERYLDLADLLAIGQRMVGTGLIGGKAVGMLLARAILRHDSPRWQELLEPHDSFYIGSDVFYAFLVHNGIWWVREKQRDPEAFLDGAEMGRQRMLTGTFPDYIVRQLEEMLDYFGQSPIIVRSSSLLEDNFGNAFAGKYDSVFCVNQGPSSQRLEDFLSAVRTIYASSMGERALRYRAQRGLLDRDEQMALLVQRVSGAVYGDVYYPQVAGVGLSFNPYVWSSSIDPEAGMLRLVFGLGTRAVDRADDDYTRVIALNAVDRRPEANFDKVRQYAQRRVDLLDLQANQLVSADLSTVARRSLGLDLSPFASRDPAMEQRARDLGVEVPFPWVLTFDGLLQSTAFVDDMREMLATLEAAYEYPVDIEFAANLADRDRYTINLLQCRPLQVKGGGQILDPPTDLAQEDIALEAHGVVIGQSRRLTVERVIYVVPSVYGELPISDRYQVARLIGRIVHAREERPPQTVLLIGPGRWGTTTPSLGVPAVFADISTVSVLCEVVAMRDDLVPDVSLGTHFLNELIELDMLYMALFPGREENHLNTRFFEEMPSRLTEIVPDAARWSHAVRVLDARDLPDGRCLVLNANALRQRVVCYLTDAP